MGTWDHLDDPRELLPLIVHPENDSTAATVEELVTSLRAAESSSELLPLQQTLAGALVACETNYGRARRALRRGQGTQFDVRFWRRSCVQSC